jgi:hypothetical protein
MMIVCMPLSRLMKGEPTKRTDRLSVWNNGVDEPGRERATVCSVVDGSE